MKTAPKPVTKPLVIVRPIVPYSVLAERAKQKARTSR